VFIANINCRSRAHFLDNLIHEAAALVPFHCIILSTSRLSLSLVVVSRRKKNKLFHNV
jgi:hypothetical protein